MRALRTALPLLLLASHAYCQATHTVVVGVKGSFYDPPTTNALEGDIITFVFGGVIHGVTQSSFEQPCSPLPGGFSSRLLGLNGSSTISPPTWSLVVSNASQPIWFFCESTRPESHCNAGMVGTINVLPDMFNQFQSSAKVVTGTPTPTPLVALTGIGAFATANPTTFSLQSSSASGSSDPGQTQSIILPSASAETSNKKSVPIGAVVGGVVGGVAVVVIAGFLFLQHRQRSRRTIEEEHQYITEKDRQSLPFRRPKQRVMDSDMSDSGSSRGDVGQHRPGSLSGTSSDLSTTRLTRQNSSMNTHPNIHNRNISYGSDQDYIAQTRHTNLQCGLSPVTISDVFNLSPSPHPFAQIPYTQQEAPPPELSSRHGPTANVHKIAKEVAALLGPGSVAPPPGLHPHPLSGSSIAHSQGRSTRQLPDPTRYLRPATVVEEPESPGLPRYER
ncbi:uncharacterized protein FOMMEDRAFT_20193 [Fomitiporia mediterranea MF3/22]|uniref:uncharacterized protein n=1 Tax=Fomitiporia mediterranea (strain MF3/22) TaxID=694068 RepID=UPI00044085D8|nr:uncharacterized protein FOMMEDRAFT_20193 [Fomitiporia mediterranea MF3/22]EJD03024.1 hypothetical protein FOMMEDRAFT_20193 [Fomitiporia mediterranea MF3/22]